MPLQSQLLAAEQVLNIELLYEPIFEALSPAELLRVARTCRAGHHAVTAYTRTAFNIDRLLSRFFPSPSPGCSAGCTKDHTHDEEHARARAFRSLQARTGTLISGSVALQFFMRTTWPESDLDLYVHLRMRREVGRWLLDEGYRYTPTEFQDPRFEVEIAECVTNRPNGIYSMPGVQAVFTFTKPLARGRRPPRPRSEASESDTSSQGTLNGREEPEVPQQLKVQIIVARDTSTPMGAILGFHSTCVMNVISYEKAYCLFPQATLEERRTLISASCLGRGRHRDDGLEKYRNRGFKVLYYLPTTDSSPDPATAYNPTYRRAHAPHGHGGNGFVTFDDHPHAFDLARSSSTHDLTAPAPARASTKKPAFQLGWRWIDDACSWVLALPLTGVAPPPAPNGATPPPTRDPVAVCGWEVRAAPQRDARYNNGVTMHFRVATAKVLRFRYLVTDPQLLEFLGKALGARMRVEEQKEAAQLEEWSYYDEELPTLCRDFLHGIAVRRLSSLRL